MNLLSFLPPLTHLSLLSLIDLVARRVRIVDLRNRCLNHIHMLNYEGDRIFLGASPRLLVDPYYGRLSFFLRLL